MSFSWLSSSYRALTKEESIARALQHARDSGHVQAPVFVDEPQTSVITIPQGATTLSREELVDRIRGLIYGQAMGDAIGLYTEFHDKEWSHKRYGSKPMTLNQSIRGWDVGDWTDDTDQMLLILDGMIRHAGEIKHTDFAYRLRFWVNCGYPELGDFSGNGCGGVVHASVRSKHFLTDPHSCARRVYLDSNGRAAANGAVMRTSILGVPHFHDLDRVIQQTLHISLTTHADPRCSASAVACTTAIALMLQGVYNPSQPETMETVLKSAEKYATALLTSDYSSSELHKHLNAEQLTDLELDEGAKIGYTYKCIGSGFWAARYGSDFRAAITELVLEGGDADTNGAVAGAMLGCKLGFKALPEEWLAALANREWLERRITHFLGLLGLEQHTHHNNINTNTNTRTHTQNIDNITSHDCGAAATTTHGIQSADNTTTAHVSVITPAS